MKDISSGLMFATMKSYMNFIMIEKVEKLAAILHDKTEYVIHTRNLNQTLNHGLVLKKFIELLSLTKILGKIIY